MNVKIPENEAIEHNYKKVKGKVIPITGLCGPEGGYRYSSTLP
jgi:hypothetical protein